MSQFPTLAGRGRQQLPTLSSGGQAVGKRQGTAAFGEYPDSPEADSGKPAGFSTPPKPGRWQSRTPGSGASASGSTALPSLPGGGVTSVGTPPTSTPLRERAGAQSSFGRHSGLGSEAQTTPSSLPPRADTAPSSGSTPLRPSPPSTGATFDGSPAAGPRGRRPSGGGSRLAAALGPLTGPVPSPPGAPAQEPAGAGAAEVQAVITESDLGSGVPSPDLGASMLSSGTFETTHHSVGGSAFYDSQEMSDSGFGGGSLADAARRQRAKVNLDLAGIRLGDSQQGVGKPPTAGHGISLALPAGGGASPQRTPGSVGGDAKNSGRAGNSLSARRRMGLKLSMAGGVGGGSAGDVGSSVGSSTAGGGGGGPPRPPSAMEPDKAPAPEPTAEAGVEGDRADWEWDAGSGEWRQRGQAGGLPGGGAQGMSPEQYAMSASGVINLGDGLQLGQQGITSGREGEGKQGASESSEVTLDDAKVFAAAARHYARDSNAAEELVMLNSLGAGASGSVRRALHLPTMQLVAVKSVRVYDVERRQQMAAELKTLYANMVPLRTWTQRPTLKDSPRAAGALGVMGDSLALDATFGGSLDASASADEGNQAPAPNLVKFFDAFTVPTAGTVNIVMEYMGGGSWEDIVKRGGCQHERLLALMTMQALQGLAWLHGHKQLHRDIKPANILITRDGLTSKLADFGIAKQLTGTQEKAQTWVGTMVYMSPERIGSGGGYSYPADIWSFGLSLLAVAAGRFPYDQKGFWDISRAVKEAPAPTHILREPHGSPAAQHTYSQEFFDFLEACMVKEPERRPSAAMLLHHPFLKQVGVSGTFAAQEALGSTLRASSLIDASGGGGAATRAGDKAPGTGAPPRAPPSTPADSGSLPIALVAAGAAATSRPNMSRADLAQLVVEVLDKKWGEFVSYYRRVRVKTQQGSHNARRKDMYDLDESTFNDDLAARFIVQQGLSKTMTRRIETRISVNLTQTLGGTGGVGRAGAPPRSRPPLRRSATNSSLVEQSEGDLLDKISKTQLMSASDIRQMAAAAKARLGQSAGAPPLKRGTAWGDAPAPAPASSAAGAAEAVPSMTKGTAGRATPEELASLNMDNLREMLTSRTDFVRLSKQTGTDRAVLRDAFNQAIISKLSGKRAKHAFKDVFKPTKRSGSSRSSAAPRGGAAKGSGGNPPPLLSRKSLKDVMGASGHLPGSGGGSLGIGSGGIAAPHQASGSKRKSDTVRTESSGAGTEVSMADLVKGFVIREEGE